MPTKYSEYVLKQAYQVQQTGDSLLEFARAFRLDKHNLYRALSKWKKERGL